MKCNAVDRPCGEIQQVTVMVNDSSLSDDRWCRQLTTTATTAACGKLPFALQTVIFLHPLISEPTPLVLGPHPLTVSAPRLHIKQYVHQETYTADLTDHSPAVKLHRRSTLSSKLLFYWQSQFNVLHYSRFIILHKIWKFCMKCGHLIPSKIFKFVASCNQISRPKCTTFFSTGTSPLTSLGEFMGFPRPSSWILGAYF